MLSWLCTDHFHLRNEAHLSAPLTRLLSAPSQDCADFRRRDVSCPACGTSETSSTAAATPAATNDGADDDDGGSGGGGAVVAAVVAVLLLCVGGYWWHRAHRNSAEAEDDPKNNPRQGVSNPIYGLPSVGSNKDDGYLDVSAP